MKGVKIMTEKKPMLKGKEVVGEVACPKNKLKKLKKILDLCPYEEVVDRLGLRGVVQASHLSNAIEDFETVVDNSLNLDEMSEMTGRTYQQIVSERTALRKIGIEIPKGNRR